MTTLRHILSVDQFSQADLDELCFAADHYASSQYHMAARGRILVNLFYEPSTRTSSSFYSAMVRLGGSVIPINNVQYSSVAKGETLEDTIRTMQCYADAIVLRHPEHGAAHRAASVASVPIINAGDGDGEHPTQALLDFYTIRKELGAVDRTDVHVVMMGDLLRGRTVKSLAKLLRKYHVRITWVSPDGLRIPAAFLRPSEVQTDDIDSVIGEADVVYLTRAQHERGSTGIYGISLETMKQAKHNMILMHPLPRLTELPEELDADPRSAYFRQMRYGLYMRMAILADVLRDQ